MIRIEVRKTQSIYNNVPSMLKNCMKKRSMKISDKYKST